MGGAKRLPKLAHGIHCYGNSGEKHTSFTLVLLLAPVEGFGQGFFALEARKERLTLFVPDVNKNDFQDKFDGYGLNRFQKLPNNQIEIGPNRPQ